MPDMQDLELVTILDSLEQDSVSYNSEFMKDNEEYLRRYNREPYGDEEEGFSQVIASDVRDTVEADMTSLVRVFLGSGEVMVFEPTSDDKADVEEQKLKTKYINHLILKRPGQYKVIHDALKDMEIQKMGVIHYFMDTVLDTRELSYKVENEISLTKLMEDLKENNDEIKKIEIVSQEDPEESGVMQVRLRITIEKQDFVTKPIPTEDFLISRNSCTVDDANLVGHVSYPTRGELVADGFSEEKVATFPTYQVASGDKSGDSTSGNSYQGTTMKSIRWRDEGGSIVDQHSFKQWVNETVRMVTAYAKIDYDKDGIAERRRIVKIGNDILENEPYDHVPYAVGSAILEPHKAIGNGRASLVVDDQSVNTALERALLDNTYDVTRPRTILGSGVNIDDFLDHRSDGVVRMQSNSSQLPRDAVMPLTTPYIGGETLQVLQYRDTQQATRAGTMLDSQGLEADQLHRETATRFAGVERAREAKIELVTRNISETFFRKLYEGAAWTLNRYQKKEQQASVNGKAIRVNPSMWRFPSIAVSQVGLGAGSGSQSVQQMTGILAIQDQLKATGSLLVDDVKTYNALDKMVQGLGLARTSDYFNNPEVPQELLMAEYQKLVMAMQQAQAMIEQLSQQNPLAEAELVKARAKLIEAQGKDRITAMKIASEERLKELDLLQKGTQFQANLTKEYTEMELEHNTDVPGQGMGA